LAFANEQSLALEERLAQIRSDVFEPKPLPYMGKETSAKEAPPAPLAPRERWGTFVDGSGDFADVGDTHEARGYDFSQGTVTLGAYYRLSDSFTAGIMASYAGSDASLADENGRVEANSMEAAAFATWSRGDFHLDAIAGGGYNSYDINTYFGVEKVGTRFEPAPVHATTDGGFGDWLLGGGYDFHIGRFVTGPIASLEYTHVTINSFSEIANTAPGSEAVAEFAGLSSKDASKLVNPVLKVMPQDVDSMKSTLGWTVSVPLDLGKQKLTPTISASWQHEYMDQQYGVNAAFPFAPGDPFTVHGPALGRDMLLFQAGLILRVNERFSVYANYLGMFARQNYSSNTIEGGARLAF
jgi:outer membrane autotransporter protein